VVRPVELQDVFAKTQAAERVADTQRAQPENDQRQAAETGQRQTEAARRKPVPPPKGDEVILHREKRKDDEKEKKKCPDQDGSQDGANNSQNQSNAGADATRNVNYDEDEPPHSIDVTV